MNGLSVSLKILELTVEMFGIECTIQNCAKNLFFRSLNRRLVTRFSKSRPIKMVGQSCAQCVQHGRSQAHCARQAARAHIGHVTRLAMRTTKRATRTAARRNTTRTCTTEDLGERQAPDHGTTIATGVLCRNRESSVETKD